MVIHAIRYPKVHLSFLVLALTLIRPANLCAQAPLVVPDFNKQTIANALEQYWLNAISEDRHRSTSPPELALHNPQSIKEREIGFISQYRPGSGNRTELRCETVIDENTALVRTYEQDNGIWIKGTVFKIENATGIFKGMQINDSVFSLGLLGARELLKTDEGFVWVLECLDKPEVPSQYLGRAALRWNVQGEQVFEGIYDDIDEKYVYVEVWPTIKFNNNAITQYWYTKRGFREKIERGEEKREWVESRPVPNPSPTASASSFTGIWVLESENPGRLVVGIPSNLIDDATKNDLYEMELRRIRYYDPQSGPRTWTDSTGQFNLDAIAIDMNPYHTRLKLLTSKLDFKIVETARLSADDNQYIVNLLKKWTDFGVERKGRKWVLGGDEPNAENPYDMFGYPGGYPGGYPSRHIAGEAPFLETLMRSRRHYAPREFRR